MTKYTTQKLGEKYEQGFDWTTWLSGATLSTSTWSVAPVTGIALSGATNNTTQTSVFADITAVGTYRLRNDVTDSAGREGWDEIVIAAEDVATESGYLSTNDAEARLYSRYRIEAELSAGDLQAASNELDSMGPWVSYKKDSGQELAFPRSVNLDGTTNTLGTIPDDILDAVALLAHHSASDEGPAVTSEAVLDRSMTYSTPKPPQAISRISALISPYLLKVGQRVGVSAYEPTEDGD